MTDISDLEQRLTGALSRMRAAHLAARAALGAAHARIAELEEASAQDPGPALVEAGDPDAVARLEAEVARLSEALEAEREQGEAIARQADADRAALENAVGEAEALRAAARLDRIGAAGEGEGTTARLTALEQAIDQLRAVNAQLRQNNAALRKAHEAGLPDADLINDALRTEIEALQAARAADRAEIDSILAALKPIVEETEDA